MKEETPSRPGTEPARVPCEMYSRVTGFYRPVAQFNPGKKEEFRQRKYYSLRKCPDVTNPG